jgi:hypothetical protein
VNQYLILAAVAGVGFIVWQKGYLDDLLGNVVATKGKSGDLFTRAVRQAIDEAKEKATEAYADKLKEQLVQEVALSFGVAGANTTAPPPPAPAATPSAGP